MADFRPLKDTPEGFEEEANPNADNLLVKGIKLQHTSGIDSAVTVTRGAAGNLVLTDALAGAVPLTAIRQAVARGGCANITRTLGRVTSVSVFGDVGETILVYSAAITRTLGKVTQVVEQERDEAGGLVRTLTTTITRTAGKVSDVNTVES